MKANYFNLGSRVLYFLVCLGGITSLSANTETKDLSFDQSSEQDQPLVLPNDPNTPRTSVAYAVKLHQLNQSQDKNLLDLIPAWIDSTPTILPPELGRIQT